MYAGFMLAGRRSWRLFFYIEAAFSGVLLIATFFFFEESAYCQSEAAQSLSDTPVDTEKSQEKRRIHSASNINVPAWKTFLRTLRLCRGLGRVFATIYRSFIYFTIPAVLWVITSYGTLSSVSF